MNRLLLIFLILVSSSYLAKSQPVSVGTLEEKADSLFKQFNEEGALNAYQQILNIRPNCHEALWKTSFLYSRVGYRLDEKQEREAYYNKARVLAERAVKLDSGATQSHFVMAVAMGRQAMIAGARDRMSAAKAVKKHADRAIELDSTNSGAWHVLGRWHFKVANLSFLERLAANALYGGIPGNASNKKAEQAIEMAIKLDPKYILYYYDLAKVYEKRGKNKQALLTCKQALKLKPIGPDDEQHKESCRELIHELQ